MKLFKAFLETNLAAYLVVIWVSATVIYMIAENLF